MLLYDKTKPTSKKVIPKIMYCHCQFQEAVCPLAQMHRFIDEQKEAQGQTVVSVVEVDTYFDAISPVFCLSIYEKERSPSSFPKRYLLP